MSEMTTGKWSLPTDKPLVHVTRDLRKIAGRNQAACAPLRVLALRFAARRRRGLLFDGCSLTGWPHGGGARRWPCQGEHIPEPMANRDAAAGKLTVAETFSSLREQGKVRAFEPSRSLRRNPWGQFTRAPTFLLLFLIELRGWIAAAVVANNSVGPG